MGKNREMSPWSYAWVMVIVVVIVEGDERKMLSMFLLACVVRVLLGAIDALLVRLGIKEPR